MPRNSAGTYSIPNTFLPGTTIASSAMNANFVDIATALTNSLTRDVGAVAGSRNRVGNPSGRITTAAIGSVSDGGVAGFAGWYALTQSNAVTTSQLTDVENGVPHMMRTLQANASAQRFGLIFPISTLQIKDQRGGAVVLSARVRMSAATTLRYAILEWTGTADSPTIDEVNDWTSAVFTAGNFFKSTTTTVTGTGSILLAANTLTDITPLAVTLGSSLTNAYVFFWTDSTQAQNVTLDIGKVQLEPGTAKTTVQYDVPVSELLDRLIGAAADGDILYRASGQWARKAIGSTAQVLSVVSGAPAWSTFGPVNLASANGFVSGMVNGTIVPSVASNILTVAIKTLAGTDPSATDPVYLLIRSATAANGDYSGLTVASALSITTNATGATLGSPNSTAFRFWLAVFNNSGTPVLALRNCYSSTRVSELDESQVASSTAMSGSATAAHTFYTPNGTTVTGMPFRILGYVEYNSTGLATAGTYASAPTFTQLFGPGVPRPGQYLQSVQASNGTQNSTTSATYAVTADTRVTITPRSAANPIRVELTGCVSSGAATVGQFQISRGTTSNTNMIGSGSTGGSTGAGVTSFGPLAIFALDKPNTASAQTYALQMLRVSGIDTVYSPNGATDPNVFIATEVMG